MTEMSISHDPTGCLYMLVKHGKYKNLILIRLLKFRFKAGLCINVFSADFSDTLHCIARRTGTKNRAIFTIQVKRYI